MDNRYGKLIHNQKGSAAVMVLSVIMILTVLGTIALMGSLNSLKMSSRYKKWSKEFYELDSKAEECVKGIDDILREADEASRAYMEEERYREDPGDPDDVQAFFYKYSWMNQEGNGSFDEYKAKYLLNKSDATDKEIADDYRQKLDSGYAECLEKVYLYFAASMLKEKLDTSLVTEKNPGTLEALTNLTSASDWENYTFDNAALTLIIKVTDSIDAKKFVEVEIDIINPKYKTIVRNEFTPVKGNPLWGYALAAGGGITVTGKDVIEVGGDIIASGGSFQLGEDSKLNVYGNLYVNGDVAIARDRGSLHVYNHATGNTTMAPVYDKKVGIYGGNTLGIDETGDLYNFSSGLSGIIEPVNSGSGLPIFYRDLEKWGNVYCRNLLINEGVSFGKLQIDGNVTTLDDIELNGESNNTISIGANYIGFSSEGAYTEDDETAYDEMDLNHSASSTIINNQVVSDDNGTPSNNRIELKGGIIVPGTAFREFKNGWYQTVESVTGRDRNIFEAYLTTPEDTDGEEFTLDVGNDETVTYYMKELDDAISERRKEFNEKLSSADIKTGIFTTDGIKGYSPGAVVTHISESDNASIKVPGISSTDDYTVNQTNWNTAKGSKKLGPYFNIKTANFGFTGKTFTSLVNPLYVNKDKMEADDMYYLNDDDDFIISGTKSSGIVFCSGDLTISGSGTFSGIILAEGNITLNSSGGDLTIKYDEGIVSKIISKSSDVRAFFSRGMIGIDDYASIQNLSAAGATKTYRKRYSTVRWQVVQEP